MRSDMAFGPMLALTLFAATASAAPLATPVRRAPGPSAFVPAGWSVEASVDGDLNGDASPDRVLVLLQDPRDAGERERALVVLLGDKDGWVVGGTNATLVACFQCLGMKGGDGTPDVRVDKRVISVGQFGGSRWYYGATHRFRWSAAARRFQLIGLEESSGDTLDGSATGTSTNFLTRDVITTIQPPQVDDKGEVDAPEIVKRRKLPPRPLEFLEDAKWFQ